MIVNLNSDNETLLSYDGGAVCIPVGWGDQSCLELRRIKSQTTGAMPDLRATHVYTEIKLTEEGEPADRAQAAARALQLLHDFLVFAGDASRLQLCPQSCAASPAPSL